MAINVALIGCGLIGKKRAAQIAKDFSSHLVVAVDIDDQNTKFLQTEYGCEILSDWQTAVWLSAIDTVIISTPNHLTADIAVQALLAGKNILVEKPFGRNVEESKKILDAAKRFGKFLVVKTGFNHRFHPAIFQAKQFLDSGKIGKLLSIRARYGHGGRPGMEKEWRASKTLCGGGELLDQGIHLIDLIQWFGQQWKEVYGMMETKFWEMSVEDNAYVLGKTVGDVHAMFHVSWTNWKNIFSLELFGSKGSMHVQGLGGSYGPEILELVLRNPQGKIPDVFNYSYPAEDSSWALEWEEFKQAVFEQREALGNGEDGLKANLVIEAIQQSHAQKVLVSVA
jgi:predicted dehydrogenase